MKWKRKGCHPGHPIPLFSWSKWFPLSLSLSLSLSPVLQFQFLVPTSIPISNTLHYTLTLTPTTHSLFPHIYTPSPSPLLSSHSSLMRSPSLATIASLWSWLWNSGDSTFCPWGILFYYFYGFYFSFYIINNYTNLTLLLCLVYEAFRCWANPF